MLGRFKQDERLRTIPIDPRTHLHANADRLCPDHAAHHPHALGEVHKHDGVRLGGRPRVDHRDRVDRAISTGDNPVPLAVAGARLRNAGRKETAAAAPGSLEAKLALRQRVSPLLLRAHVAKLWAAK